MADDDSDWAGFSEAMRQRSKERRANNREFSTALLSNAGLKFEAHNAGAHLIVHAPNGLIDFWPGTGKWIDRKTKVNRRGVHPLLAFIKRQT